MFYVKIWGLFKFGDASHEVLVLFSALCYETFTWCCVMFIASRENISENILLHFLEIFLLVFSLETFLLSIFKFLDLKILSWKNSVNRIKPQEKTLHSSDVTWENFKRNKIRLYNFLRSSCNAQPCIEFPLSSSSTSVWGEFQQRKLSQHEIALRAI
jgi:hypothetical protein